MLSYPPISFDLWKNLDDPAQRIDRVIQDRSHRLCMGVAVSSDLQSLSCVVAMTSGHGKFLRLNHVVGQEVKLPETLRASGLELSPDMRLQDTRQFMSEMADLQSQAIDAVKRQAGKYVDRILAVAVTDPGIWLQDFDKSAIYCPMADSQRIAELTGLTVIDNFPANDLFAGGSGGVFEALPMWLAFADRNRHVACAHRVVIVVDQNARYDAWLLPASDGLDADLPPIQLASGDANEDALEQLRDEVVQGMKLIEKLTGVSGDGINESALVFGRGDFASELAAKWGWQLIGDSPCPAQGEGNAYANLSALTISGAMTAILGLLHIDQMQANVPWLTGATEQRVLGRLTPGAPSNWRQLVREMADFRPPAMKLKDAV